MNIAPRKGHWPTCEATWMREREFANKNRKPSRIGRMIRSMGTILIFAALAYGAGSLIGAGIHMLLEMI